MSALREELLRSIPDRPRTVELRSMLLDPTTEISGDPSAAIIFDRDVGLLVIHGRPPRALIEAALPPARGILVPADDVERTWAPPEWRWVRAVIEELGDRSRIDALDAIPAEIEVWDGSPLDAPAELVREQERVRPRSEILLLRVEGRPAAFAYAVWRSERYFDVAIDTVESFRGRGLGRRLAARLITREIALNRRPVWGALEDNLPSLRVAAALGFVPCDNSWVAEPPT